MEIDSKTKISLTVVSIFALAASIFQFGVMYENREARLKSVEFDLKREIMKSSEMRLKMSTFMVDVNARLDKIENLIKNKK